MKTTSHKGSIFSQQHKKLSQQNKKLKSDYFQHTESNISFSNDFNCPEKSKQANNFNESPSLNNINIASSSKSFTQNINNLPKQSYILTGSDKNDIHEENLNKLKQMTEEEIMEEKEKLQATLDPAIIQFLRSRRKKESVKTVSSIPNQNKIGDDVNIEDLQAPVQILSQPDAEKWLNFDTIETNKLAWMKDVDIPKMKENKNYEARFDFTGSLLPFTEDEVTDKSRVLYHHGEEPGRPGYTLQELIQLCRSSVNQQKIVALNTIGNLLSLESSGIYDNILELPIEQVFFVLRFCLDDNTPNVLTAAVKALRSLFYYPIDEICLDALLGFGLGMVQPILPVDADETEDDNTVNDQQLAETNLIKCLIRSGILIRIRYIINTVRPPLETVVACLEILTRLARDSMFVVMQVCKCENLIKNIVEFFVPKTFTLGNLLLFFDYFSLILIFISASNECYGVPLSQAVRFLRVLCTRSKEVALLVNRYISCYFYFFCFFSLVFIFRYNVVDSITEYLANEHLSENSNGLKLQIESMHLWAVLVRYQISLDSFKLV